MKKYRPLGSRAIVKVIEPEHESLVLPQLFRMKCPVCKGRCFRVSKTFMGRPKGPLTPCLDCGGSGFVIHRVDYPRTAILAEIIAVGPGRAMPNGERESLGLAPGDRIAITPAAAALATKVIVDGVECLFVKCGSTKIRIGRHGYPIWDVGQCLAIVEGP